MGPLIDDEEPGGGSAEPLEGGVAVPLAVTLMASFCPHSQRLLYVDVKKCSPVLFRVIFAGVDL